MLDKEKLLLKWVGMLALSGLDLRQAHPLSLAQQVLSRLPANDMGIVRFVLVMVSLNVKAVTLVVVRVIDKKEVGDQR